MPQHRATEIESEPSFVPVIVRSQSASIACSLDKTLEYLDNVAQMVQALRIELLEVRQLWRDRVEDIHQIQELAGPGDDDAEVPQTS